MKIEVLEPVNGRVVLLAKEKGNPIEGIEIRVEGESKGRTGAGGELEVQSILAGTHNWEALDSEGREAKGMIEIPEITQVEYVPMSVERDGQTVTKWHPLTDTLSFVIEITNTGTTVVDHFTWRQTADIGHMKIDLLHPKMPAKVWRPFAGNLLSGVTTVETRIDGDRVMMIDTISGISKEVISRTPFTPGGLQPGEKLVVEQTGRYWDSLQEAMDSRGIELGTEIKLNVVDEGKGIVDMVIKEYKFGPIKLHDMKARVIFKGPFKVCHEVFVDGELFGSDELGWELL